MSVTSNIFLEDKDEVNVQEGVDCINLGDGTVFVCFTAAPSVTCRTIAAAFTELAERIESTAYAEAQR